MLRGHLETDDDELDWGDCHGDARVTPMEELREARGATVHGVAKSQTQLSDFTHSLTQGITNRGQGKQDRPSVSFLNDLVGSSGIH